MRFWPVAKGLRDVQEHNFHFPGFRDVPGPRDGAGLLKVAFGRTALVARCAGGERVTARKDGSIAATNAKRTSRFDRHIFERSHVPLHKWIYAMYLLVTARKGISSMQLAKEIGITQKSAGSSFSGCARHADRSLRSCKASSKSMKPSSAGKRRTSTSPKS